MAKMKLSVGAITDVGMRRVNNEDNFYIPGVKIKGKDVKVYDIRQEHAKGLKMEDGNAFFAVCDGMGGHNAGEYASLMAVKAIENAYAKVIMVNEYQQGKEVFDAFLSEVNAQISSAAAQDPDMAGMGCTLCGLYFFGSNRVMPVNVGDSRIYMVKGTKLIQLSVDHIDSSSGKGALTRYLGMPEEYGDVTGEYGVRHEVLSKKTRFLLCSDGLTDMVSPEDILYHLRKAKTAEDAAERLVDAAKKMGGEDNITAVVIDATPVGKVISRTLRRPGPYIAAAAVLTAFSSGYGYYWHVMRPPEPVERIVGESLGEYQQKLADANSAQEIFGVLEGMLQKADENISNYKGEKEAAKGAGIQGDVSYERFNDCIYSYCEARKNLQQALDAAKQNQNGSEQLNQANELKSGQDPTADGTLKEGSLAYWQEETEKACIEAQNTVAAKKAEENKEIYYEKDDNNGNSDLSGQNRNTGGGSGGGKTSSGGSSSGGTSGGSKSSGEKASSGGSPGGGNTSSGGGGSGDGKTSSGGGSDSGETPQKSSNVITD